MKLDFRSDTVTHPTQEMRNAMALAPVGDDVYEDDPTVNELQAYTSELFQTEAALYVCSGTMGNLLAILCHCDRGDGVLVGKEAHIWSHEAGGMACIAGTMPFQLDDSAGIPSVEEIRAQYRAPGDVHVCPTTLLALENTHNFMGGLPIAPAVFAEVAGTARALGMKVHLDGARLFNACTAFEVPPSRYAAEVDSVQVCLSKGLGAPMGSMLCGKRAFIEKARMWRKKLGGGQRQVGIAAAGNAQAQLCRADGRIDGAEQAGGHFQSFAADVVGFFPSVAGFDGGAENQRFVQHFPRADVAVGYAGQCKVVADELVLFVAG